MKTTVISLAPEEWPARYSRVPSLDGIRAISLILVLAGHFVVPRSLIGISALGLKVFFFLSGFLITRLLFAETKAHGRICLKKFYGRRIIRLYPVLIIYVSVCIAVSLVRGDRIDGVDVASVFLYFVNYRVIYYYHTAVQYTLPVQMLWSLSIEEHFYVVAPIVIAIFVGQVRMVFSFAIIVCVTALFLRLLYAYQTPDIVDTLELYWRSETRFDSIAYGVILACLGESNRGKRVIEYLSTKKLFIFGAVVLTVSFIFRNNYFQNTWRFTVQGLALMPLIAGVVFNKNVPWINRGLNSFVMRWIGKLSYSIYVWHGGVDFLFEPYFVGVPPLILPWLHVAAALLLASLSYYFVENPILALRQKFSVAQNVKGALPLFAERKSETIS